MQFDLTAKTIYLRLVTEDDAAFICQLRSDEQLGKFISPSSDQEEVQRQWIVDYKQREAAGLEYYFITCRKSDDLPVGTIRIYDFQENPKSFRWGSWILNKDKPKYAAVETALLIYKLGFDYLNFEQGRFEVMKGNERVHNFNLRMGAKPVSEDDQFIYYTFSKEQHELNKREYQSFLEA